MILFTATFETEQEAKGFYAYLTSSVGAANHSVRGLEVSFTLPAVQAIATAAETWGGALKAAGTARIPAPVVGHGRCPRCRQEADLVADPYGGLPLCASCRDDNEPRRGRGPR